MVILGVYVHESILILSEDSKSLDMYITGEEPCIDTYNCNYGSFGFLSEYQKISGEGFIKW